MHVFFEYSSLFCELLYDSYPEMQDLLTDYKKNRAWYVRKTDSGVSLDEIK